MPGSTGGFVAGSIIGKLLMDKSGWNKSVADTAKDEKKLKGMSERTSKNFRKMGMAMTVAGGAIIGALGAMTKKFVDAGDEIDKVSRRTGLAAESLSELKYAAELSGGSLADVEKSVKRMSGTILDANSGLETYIRAFDQMGVSVDDLMKMNPEQQFLSISEAIAEIEDPTIRAALAQDVFGRSGTALMPIFDQGAQGLRKMREEAQEVGVVFSQDAARSAADLKDAQHELSQSVKGLAMSFVKDLAPHLTDFIKKVSDTVQKVTTWIKENPKLTLTITKIAGAVGVALTVLGPLLMMLPGIVLGAKAMSGAFTALLSPVGLLVAALAALAIGYMKVKAAQDKAEKSSRTAAEQEAKLFEKLKESAEAAGMTAAEFDKLKESYDDNAAALAMAIKHGDEGIEMQKALTEHTSDYEVEAAKAAKESDNFALSMEDLTGRFQGYLDEVEEVNVQTKTWVDYLESVGKKTVKEKADRVEELTGFLDGLREAYDKDLISMKDFIESTRIATAEIKELSTELTTTTIPAARDMASVYGQAVSDMKTETGDFTIDTVEEIKKTESAFGDMSQRIKDAWVRELGEMLVGAKSFKDAAGAVWDEIKRMFADMVAKMVVNFAIDGVKDLIGGATKAAKGIGSAVEGIGAATAPLAAGIGTLITTLAKAIATAAEIIAASAPAILIAAGVALAIYAGFKIISSLFKKTAKPGSELDFLRQITENTFTIKDLLLGDYKAELHALQNIGRDIFGKVESLNPKADARLKTLREIAKNTAPIKDMISAQRGAIITKPTLAALHGTPSKPEIVMPFDGMSPRGAQSAQRSVRYDPTFNINVNGTMITDRDYTRQRMLPEMLNALEQHEGKRRLERIMGLAK